MCRVILADDERLEVEALKIIIKDKVKMASVVGEAYSGDEVIKMNDSLNPDVIFMDVVMPGIDGLKVAEIIKKKDSSKKIVLMSAYDNFEFVQQALRIKVDDYLLKPIRPEKIVSILKKFISEDESNCNNNSLESLNNGTLGYSTDELEYALNYIEKNFKNNITLKDVADYVKFSSTYLSKLFKKNIGTNFNKYITQKRIEESKKILKSTNISINDLAFDVGYNEPNYFCKVFKKEVGMTPSEYRDECNHKKV